MKLKVNISKQICKFFCIDKSVTHVYEYKQKKKVLECTFGQSDRLL